MTCLTSVSYTHLDVYKRQVSAVVQEIILLESGVTGGFNRKLRIRPAFIEADRLVDYVFISAFKAVMRTAVRLDKICEAA